MTAAGDKFCDIFPNLKKNQVKGETTTKLLSQEKRGIKN